MDIKHLQFEFKLYWKYLLRLLTIVAEGIIMTASLAALFILIYQFGFYNSSSALQNLGQWRLYILIAFFWGITLRYITKFKDIIQEKMIYLDISIYTLLFAVLSAKVFFQKAMEESLPYLYFFTDTLFIYLLLFVLSIIHLSRQTFALLQSHIKPSFLFLLSFVFIILVGSGLLMLPNATHGHALKYIDALFISTTSVCVTGLTTVDVATTFTHTGQVIIMLLIQIGGIGVMTFTSFFALSFMGNSSFSSKLALKNILSVDNVNGIFRMIINILIVTLIIEGLGAYFIFKEIEYILPGNMYEKLFYAIFHSISAFCNAGISTLSGNMYDPIVAHAYGLHVCIGLLIILGGLGFPILFNYLKLLKHLALNMAKMLINKKSYTHAPHIININTYLVVSCTAVLIIGGTIGYYLLEMHHSLAGLPIEGQIADSFLGAVTPRTAGFCVADMASLTQGTLMLTLLLMIIGAAPMSTGGGLKVTTVYVAFRAALDNIRGKNKVEVRKRQISEASIKNAFTIIVLYFTWMLIAVFGLTLTEKNVPVFTLFFETVSALSTVGLSLNFSPLLTTLGKLIIIMTMLVGRIGILTFFTAFVKNYKAQNIAYPKEDISM